MAGEAEGSEPVVTLRRNYEAIDRRKSYPPGLIGVTRKVATNSASTDMTNAWFEVDLDHPPTETWRVDITRPEFDSTPLVRLDLRGLHLTGGGVAGRRSTNWLGRETFDHALGRLPNDHGIDDVDHAIEINVSLFREISRSVLRYRLQNRPHV